ncbi:glycosyl hydrolase family 28-related protein [Mycolicibacterium sphagni]|uniref:glycosyl hydrolase family 28-related protein n=1 Tax=Mycolicibacterium sphagni TaxID=1786 RepID=UPI0021F36036|nr:glycosyl hydrolase family 28-related protein [Mycolicibacterium sphagni]MCV7174947.1 right-handed parallel beta-helix repeat-containing protein [Mycolicibacterium sphagni]
MAQLEYFQVTGNYRVLSGTYNWSATAPETQIVHGIVVFTPKLKAGDSLQAVDMDPPANLILKPVVAAIENGILVYNHTPGVLLAANTDALHLAEGTDLYYQVDYSNLHDADGGTVTLKSFDFAAPTNPDTGIDLVTVTPVAGTVGQGSIVGPDGLPTYPVRISVNPDVYQWYDAAGNPVGEPGPLTVIDGTTHTINVMRYGAVGDGIADDSAAIQEACAALTDHSILYFPTGKYRFAQQNPPQRAAVSLTGLSNCGVVFDPTAVLLMDNLDGDGLGTSNGILITGSCSNIAVINPTVIWKTIPSARGGNSHGIRVVGYPSDDPPADGWLGSTGLVEYLTIENPYIESAPEAGIYLSGASDVAVLGSKINSTMADGLHFNACRRLTVNGHHCYNNGDDGLAFVNYYHATELWQDPTIGPFNQPSLGEWCSTGSASAVVVKGNRSNGFRVQMCQDLAIGDVMVDDKDIGFSVTSAQIGDGSDWQSLASNNVTIDNVTIRNTHTDGFNIQTLLIDNTMDPMWWDFTNCQISNITIELQNAIWSVSGETPDSDQTIISGFAFTNITAAVAGTTPDTDIEDPNQRPNGGMRWASFVDCTFDNIKLETTDYTADCLFLGAAEGRTEHLANGVTVNPGVTVESLPLSNLTIGTVVHRGPGRVLFQDIAGVTINGAVESYSADGEGVIFNQVRNVRAVARAVMPARGTGVGRGARVDQSSNVDLDVWVDMDANLTAYLWQSFEIGGGDATYPAGKGIRVNLIYTSDFDATDSQVAVQTGPYAPVGFMVQTQWLHKGVESPVWQSELLGDPNPAYQTEAATHPAWVSIADGNYIDFDTYTESGLYLIACVNPTGFLYNDTFADVSHQPPNHPGILELQVTTVDLGTDGVIIRQQYKPAFTDLTHEGYRINWLGDGWTDWQTNALANGVITIDMLDSQLQTVIDSVAGGTNSQGGSYTAELSDANKLITISSTTASVFTVPPNASAPFPVGTVLRVTSINSGAVTLAAAAGVFIGTHPGLTLAGTFAVATLFKYDTDNWLAFGDLIS